MVDENHAKKVAFHRAMLRVLSSIGDLERSFDVWARAAQVLDASGSTADEAAEHAALDETRAAFARIIERFPAAAQVMGLEQFARQENPQ